LTKAASNSLTLIVLPMSPRNYTLCRTLIHPAGFVQRTSVSIRVAVDGIMSGFDVCCIVLLSTVVCFGNRVCVVWGVRTY